METEIERMFHQDLFSFIILLGVIQGVLLSLFFLGRNRQLFPSSVFLGLLLLFMALHNIDFWAGYTLFTLLHPHWLDISVPLSLAMGPLIYHYVMAWLKGKTPPHALWHYLPAICYLGYSLFFLLQSEEFKYNVFIISRELDLPLQPNVSVFSADPLQIRQYTGIIISVQLTLYFVMSLVAYIRFRNGKTGDAERISPEGLLWLRNILVTASVIVITAVIIQLAFPGGREEFLLAVCFTLMVYYTGYQLIRNSGFFKQAFLREKYAKSSLREPMKDELIAKIEAYLNHDKPYLNNLFSAKIFARGVGASPNHLSQVLNEHYQKSFFEFVAGLRIREACHLLSDAGNDPVTIEEIAFRVGYNSKSAFNKSFKSITGKTPLNFRKGN